MAWQYEVGQIRRVTVAPNLTYMLVGFWRSQAEYDAAGADPDAIFSKQPFLVNDFGVRIDRSGQVFVEDPTGDVFLDDPETGGTIQGRYDTVNFTAQDLIGRLRAVIEGYADRAAANGYEGDHTGDPDRPFKKGGSLVRQRPGTTRLAADDVANGINDDGAVRIIIGVKTDR